MSGSTLKSRKTWRDSLQVHPAADVFPMLAKGELKELAEDIKEHGLHTKVVTYVDAKTGEETLLDGRNRLDALELAGFDVVNPDGSLKKRFFGGGPLGGDPVAFVVSANIRRRHLSSKQKREGIAMLLKDKPERSNGATAAIVGASPHTVAKVREELEENGDVCKTHTREDSTGRKQPAHKPKAPKAVETADIQSVLFDLLDQQAAALAKLGHGTVTIKTTVRFSDGTTIERTTKA